MQAGASADDITILQTRDDPQAAASDPRDELPDAHRRQVRLATHHPGERKDLSYLGADEHDEPIYISRHLFDADVVVPIGCVRLDDALRYGGVRATLYPAFADQAAQERCRVAGVNGAVGGRTTKQRSRRTGSQAAQRATTGTTKSSGVSQHEANHVAWLLGVLFSVQVVPGAADSVLHVLAGHLEVVLERGRELSRQAWAVEVPRRAGLVVAALTGSAEQQTWDNVGRAVAAAQRVVNDNGIITLCTELSQAHGAGYPRRGRRPRPSASPKAVAQTQSPRCCGRIAVGPSAQSRECICSVDSMRSRLTTLGRRTLRRPKKSAA